MNRTELLQGNRVMRFESIYEDWLSGRITQPEAAQILGMCDRTFRRWMKRYQEADESVEGLIDLRMNQISHRRAPVDEVMALADLYGTYYQNFNVRHFHQFYYEHHEGKRSYNWVLKTLQAQKLVVKAPKRGKHRKKRERCPLAGMMIHQDGSTHEWIPNVKWDLIVTMDDATSEHYDMRFVAQEGTMSSFAATQAVIEKHGLFCSFYSDRGSHYWFTPEAGGRVDKTHRTQFGRALHQLGIQMIAAYSPEARGRSERAFATHQGRLPQELALLTITDIQTANRYLQEVYMPAHNRKFKVPPTGEGTAFAPWIGTPLKDILCEHYERTVQNDHCVSFNTLSLQIPANDYRYHYAKVKVRVHSYNDGTLALFHGHQKLAEYDSQGKLIEKNKTKKNLKLAA